MLTTNQGVILSENQNSQGASPTLLGDFILREKPPFSITSAFQNVIAQANIYLKIPNK